MGKVLIAEDDPVSRKVCASLVQSEGHSPVEAENGRLAWEFLDANPDVNLLVTDVEMPEMGGLDLIQRLRKDRRFEHLPIIIVSGKVSVRQIASFLEEGATVFLAKPVKGSEFAQYVSHFLSLSR